MKAKVKALFRFVGENAYYDAKPGDIIEVTEKDFRYLKERDWVTGIAPKKVKRVRKKKVDE